MKNIVKIYARPKLKNPVMLASWPGIGDVSLIVANYLLKKLDFKELGEIEPSYFFDAIGVVAKSNVIEAPQFPQSRFYYFKNEGGDSDVILFIGEDQPVTKSYELANCVLDVAAKFQAKRVYTCAAALSRIHHTEQPRVWGVVTSSHMSAELDKYELVQRGNLQIAGLNGLLLGVAKERDVEGMCLLGEVPMHATRLQNPVAALAVLQALTGILKIEVEFGELIQIAQEAAERLKQVAAEAMGEYIDNFTRPIWEYGEEIEDDIEDDEEEN
ncbi:MAG: PAC2 family protein [Dehalococcoidia bacterium]|jgi:proteasome assembly chaperone (PAC2) family protein